eukprot:TRINITY_DN41582_c0_g1_i1.p1 TRINITY_DN41582_c0_g1~~TRINITY_DN41582_c0_g1_i1.p1  ORF type:complete len:292 (+),score=51.89 TRINITY_DN41582_c0_g1_i1:27-878(+)
MAAPATVLLGCDVGALEEVVEDPEERLDPTLCKAGGLPVLPEWASSFDVRQNQCGVCGHPMYLLVQFWPEESVDRLILVFCCNTAACNKEPAQSWKAWRLQAPEGAPESEQGEEREMPYSFPARFLDVCEEPEEENEKPIDVEAEMKKMEEFNKQNPDITNEDVVEAESEVPVDHAFMRFQRRVSRKPNQVVRWGGAPLWISAWGKPESTAIPPCLVCGAPRKFELEVIPTAVYYLKPADHVHAQGDEGMDFGAVAVYTCSQNCNITCGFAPEFTFVQPPPAV